ncbi:SART-1 protein [Truncatella angustata]|uniref:SART-1 protein n=1 Tax=Truncatella angustata TaxID=152316 RepID=A0A9P9A0U1_9PEZI|nr:SART-1 protein [Truncatella angustata]KAH6656330.1 SART-1 protein [Truncatella angustata]
MDAATIKEINKTRIAAGMQPLPVPGESGPQFKEKTASDDDGEEPASTLDTREAAAEDNYRKVRDAEEAKRRRDEKNAAIRKARDAAKRLELLQGKGLGDADNGDDLDAKAWLLSQKKRQKQIDKARKYEAEQAAAEAEEAAKREYTSKDLAGVKVTHEISAFEDGDEQILTLKDSNIIGDDDEGDELENLDLRDREKLQEKLELKKKKPVYDPHAINEDGESSILAHYDDEINGKKTKKFVLGEQSTGRHTQLDNLAGGPQNRKLEKISLDLFKDEQPSSDYLDISEIKVKKPKKKKSKSTRQRQADDDDILLPDTTLQDESMEVDSGAEFISRKRKTEDTSFADDEDLQATLAIQRRDALKKRKRTRPEDIARQFKEESKASESEAGTSDAPDGGLVIDEISEFVSGLKKEDLEDRKPRTSKTPNREVTTAMEDGSDSDEHMKDVDEVDHEARHRETSTPAEIGTTGVEEEKAIGVGVGAALQLLRERKVLKDTGADELNESFRRQQNFLAEKRKREAAVDQQARDARERDRTSGKLDRMSAREREDWQRRQNEMRDQQTSRQMADLFNRDYKPNVQLKYTDEHGRSLDQKGAFRQLSHQFHGKGSSKGKLDKQLKKIEDEKRRESQSILDSSQNANMSSATAQQTKKRREAGVRLA